jgi:DNA-binding NarL/FixJ family response regulator
MYPTKVFIADDHSIVREGIRLILSKEPDYEVTGEEGDGRKALEEIERHPPHVAILDISMTSITGLDVAREIKRVHPEVKIIILSQYDNDEYVSEAMEIGVEGYVMKQDVSDTLLSSISAVMNGYNYLSPRITTRFLDEYRDLAGMKKRPRMAAEVLRSPYRTLTKREREILKLVSEGKKNREIASLLFISDQTVKVHRRNIMKKLNVGSVTELVRYAMKHGLIE